MSTEIDLESRFSELEADHVKCKAEVSTSITYIKWALGITVPAFLIVAGASYVKADRASATLSTEAQVRFAAGEERYKAIQKDLKALDEKIDERFSHISKTLDEMRKPK